MRFGPKHMRVIAVTAAAVLWIPTIQTDGDVARARDLDVDLLAPYQVVYVFDPDIDDHLVRLQHIQLAMDPFDATVDVVGVYLPSEVPDVFSDMGRRFGPTFFMVPASAVREREPADAWESSPLSPLSPMSGRVVTWLEKPHPEAEDFLLLESRAGALVVEGTGEVLPEVTSALAASHPGPVMTEVDFNTWGKVKELFK